MREMYQNYNETDLSDAQVNKLRVKENKKRMKEAREVAKAANKAAKFEAEANKQKRLKGARDVLDNAGYKDVRVSLNIPPACTGPACGPQTYEAKVASANRKLKSEEIKAQQVSATRTLNMGPTRSMAAKPRYGYSPYGSRAMPVPVTKQGYVRQDYLQAVQNGRAPRSIAMDARGTSDRVYPARLTPKQAGAWMKNPGCGDIVGIDAPKTAVPTVYRSRNAASSEEPVYLSYRPALPVSKESRDQHMKMVDPQGRAYMVKTTPNGHVSKSYLQQINSARPVRARAMDDHRTAMRVIPASPTPYQAKPWIEAPGKYDIQGIDAPEDVPVTYRRARTPEEASEKRSQTAKKKSRSSSGQFVKAGSPNASKPKKKSAAKAKSPQKVTKKVPSKPATNASKPAPKKASSPAKSSAGKQTKLPVASANKKVKSSGKKGSKR